MNFRCWPANAACPAGPPAAAVWQPETQAACLLSVLVQVSGLRPALCHNSAIYTARQERWQVTGVSVPAVTATAKVPLPGACAGFSRLHTQAGMKASQCTGRFGTHRQGRFSWRCLAARHTSGSSGQLSSLQSDLHIRAQGCQLSPPGLGAPGRRPQSGFVKGDYVHLCQVGREDRGLCSSHAMGSAIGSDAYAAAVHTEYTTTRRHTRV